MEQGRFGNLISECEVVERKGTSRYESSLEDRPTLELEDQLEAVL